MGIRLGGFPITPGTEKRLTPTEVGDGVVLLSRVAVAQFSLQRAFGRFEEYLSIVGEMDVLEFR